MVKKVADRQGFEPWNTVRCYLLSKQAPSTARPSVRYPSSPVPGTSRGANDSNSSLFRLLRFRGLRGGERRRCVETGLVLATNTLRRVEGRHLESIARIGRLKLGGRLERWEILRADVVLVVLFAGRSTGLASWQQDQRQRADDEDGGN